MRLQTVNRLSWVGERLSIRSPKTAASSDSFMAPVVVSMREKRNDAATQENVPNGAGEECCLRKKQKLQCTMEWRLTRKSRRSGWIAHVWGCWWC